MTREVRSRFFLCLLLAAFASLSCSLPNLEPTECSEARDAVREFYSYHFGNDMTFSLENLEKRKEYLMPGLYETLQRRADTADPFTLTSNHPKAFRVGECKVIEPGRRTNLQILLFWKDDTRSEQRSINVEVENEGDRWLIQSVKP